MWKQAVAKSAQGKNQKAKIARRFNIIFQNQRENILEDM